MTRSPVRVILGIGRGTAVLSVMIFGESTMHTETSGYVIGLGGIGQLGYGLDSHQLTIKLGSTQHL